MAENAIVLVTGAKTCLGFEIVRALYESPRLYEFLLGYFNEEKGQDVKEATERGAPMSRSSLTTIQMYLPTSPYLSLDKEASRPESQPDLYRRLEIRIPRQQLLSRSHRI